MKIIRTSRWLLVAALLLSTYSGCSSLAQRKLTDSDGRFNLLKRLGTKKDKEVDFQTPQSMVAIWKASTYEKAGSKSLRGFGGRFYFYDANNEPVRVKGDLTIYGYDDHNPSGLAEGKADRKFVFKSESLNSHFSESALGESYSFWVPWDNVGGEQKTITLIPVFKTDDGHVPQAKPATMRLPGKRGSKSMANVMTTSPSQTGGVVQASAELPATSSASTTIAAPAAKRRQTRRAATTLRLTPRLAEHLSAPINRNRSTSATAKTDVPEKAKSMVANGSVSTTKKSDDKPKDMKNTAQPPARSPSTVFGQPGAFR